MSDDAEHVKEIIDVIERESKHSREILETLSFMATLLNDCDMNTKNFRKAHVQRVFKIGKLTIEVKYGSL